LIEAGPELLAFERDSLPVAQFTGIGVLHRWLRPGETIVTEIREIGQLVNPVVAEA
jgi:2-keto-4-pentenoate hydratase/2-oxohepta-3-ene-1,7-dioic acid hydratase in catechol pathway